MLLLGAAWTLTVSGAVVDGPGWAGRVVVSSSNGWDSDGEGTASWSGWNAVAITTSLSTFSLQESGSGQVTWQASR
jgi:hypothetical protein